MAVKFLAGNFMFKGETSNGVAKGTLYRLHNGGRGRPVKVKDGEFKLHPRGESFATKIDGATVSLKLYVPRIKRKYVRKDATQAQAATA